MLVKGRVYEPPLFQWLIEPQASELFPKLRGCTGAFLHKWLEALMAEHIAQGARGSVIPRSSSTVREGTFGVKKQMVTHT